MNPRRHGEIGFLPLVAILFFNVSGGPYGLEDAVGSLAWRVGGGATGMWLVAGLPALCCLLAMATAGWANTVVGVLAAPRIGRARIPRFETGRSRRISTCSRG